jgi:Transglutaminase-like superfamily
MPVRVTRVHLDSIDYAAPGPLTTLNEIDPRLLEGLGSEPVEICWPVHRLVIQPDDAERAGVPAARLAEKSVRPAAVLIAVLIALDPSPLHVPRMESDRVVGTCRHFAVLSCALLRHRGIPARVRCGFATYFQLGQALDHWITEYWSEGGHWVRIDTEVLGGDVLREPEDLAPEQFLSGGEAWAAFRKGTVDGSTFGVYGTANFGPAEIRGNAIKDLAALNKVEMLPWDEWGLMPDIYRGETGPDIDTLLDEIATVSASGDVAAIAQLYRSESLQVPDEILM